MDRSLVRVSEGCVWRWRDTVSRCVLSLATIYSLVDRECVTSPGGVRARRAVPCGGRPGASAMGFGSAYGYKESGDECRLGSCEFDERRFNC